MKTLLKRFVSEEHGLETVEYAVLLALIAVALTAAIGLLSTAITGKFTGVTATINGTSGSGG
jgi:Flp pilus assembly pilin Flp